MSRERNVADVAPRSRTWRNVCLALIVGAIGGYTLRSPSHAIAGQLAGAECPEPSTDVRSPAPSAAPIVLTAAAPALRAPARENEDQELAHRQGRSRELMLVLQSRVGLAKLLPHATSPEAVANEVETYLQGWTDAVTRGAPELVDELAAELEQRMCAPHVEDGELVVLAQAVTRMPELANARGLDCLLARPTEDYVLWTALEAWDSNAARLPPSAMLRQVELRATDERTLSRLRFMRAADERAVEPPEQ